MRQEQDLDLVLERGQAFFGALDLFDHQFAVFALSAGQHLASHSQIGSGCLVRPVGGDDRRQLVLTPGNGSQAALVGYYLRVRKLLEDIVILGDELA